MADSVSKKEYVSVPVYDASRTDLPVAESLYVGAQKALKYASLVTLTVQNAAMNLTMRMARTQQDLFISSTAVVMSEIIKLITCLFMVGIDEGSVVRWASSLNKTVFKQPWDTFKSQTYSLALKDGDHGSLKALSTNKSYANVKKQVAIPSLVYTLQNNLIYIGATHLDAATCQVTYQLKILTTAVFSVAMLHKRLHILQWLALILLFIGVALVQVAQLSAPTVVTAGREQHPLLGFVAIVVACCLSGFAGVYFEKILKGSDISVWMRNVQLSVFAIPIGLCTTFIFSKDEVSDKGFFFGYNTLVWLVILLQAIGGLVVAVVVKFADNILKGFATSLAIVVSCVISVYAFDFYLTAKFVIGAGLVVGSIFLYSQPQKLPSFELKK